MVRGIATGSFFKRLVAKTLAKQCSAADEKACTPFQFARARVDVEHAIRFAADEDPETTVLSIDGIGAYDYVLWLSVMTTLLEIPYLRGLLPS